MKFFALLMTILAACHSAPRAQAPVSPGPDGAKRANAGDVGLTAELAGRRAQLLGWLHDYTEAGQFPTDDAGLPRSVFVDSKGIRCPMAELIYRSGHADLVEAVAREHNEVRLAAVTEGPLHDWMLGSGLTMDEIALIQGAADIDMTWLRQEAPSQETILARGEMRGRLESAERAVRDGTAHSLEVALAKLPNGKLPVAKITGQVVPVAALKSGPQGRPLAPPRTAILQPRWRIQDLDTTQTANALRN
jgi:hypothetical protein